MLGILVGVAALAGAGAAAQGLEGQDRPLSADFPEVYRAGGFDAEEWAEFRDAPAVGFDAEGRLYALDTSAGHVVVIGDGGRLVRIVGSPGEGPGEFDEPEAFVVWRDGRVAVADLGHNAYQIFAPDGEFDRFVRMGGGSDILGGITNSRLALRPDPGRLAIVAQGMPSRLGAMTSLLSDLVGAEASDEGGVDDRGLERLDLLGDEAVGVTILEAWRPPSADEEVEALTMSDLGDASTMVDMMVGDTRWFEPYLLWDVLPDGGIAYADSSAYRIKVTDDTGRVLRSVVRPFTPVPVTRRIRSATRGYELRNLEEGTGEGLFGGLGAQEAEGAASALLNQMKEAAREKIEDIEFFEEVSVLLAMRATWEGALWIQRRGDEPWDRRGPIDVMGAGGEYVGTFAAGATRIPDAFGPDGLVAFIELDELDIPSIVVRRLPAEVR